MAFGRRSVRFNCAWREYGKIMSSYSYNICLGTALLNYGYHTSRLTPRLRMTSDSNQCRAWNNGELPVSSKNIPESKTQVRFLE